MTHRWGISIADYGNGYTIRLLVSDVQIYESRCEDPYDALEIVKRTMERFEDLPVSVFTRADRIKITGRKVYYRYEPAEIYEYIVDQGKVVLKRVGTSFFNRPPWQNDETDKLESMITDDILSPEIWWFRD